MEKYKPINIIQVMQTTTTVAGIEKKKRQATKKKPIWRLMNAQLIQSSALASGGGGVELDKNDLLLSRELDLRDLIVAQQALVSQSTISLEIRFAETTGLIMLQLLRDKSYQTLMRQEVVSRSDWHRAEVMANRKRMRERPRIGPSCGSEYEQDEEEIEEYDTDFEEAVKEIYSDMQRDMIERMRRFLTYIGQLPAIATLPSSVLNNLIRYNYFTVVSLLVNKIFINDE